MPWWGVALIVIGALVLGGAIGAAIVLSKIGNGFRRSF